MPPTQHPTAWDDPATRRAWRKLMTWAVLGQILWPATCVGLMAWYVRMPIWTLWFFFVPMIYSFYRTFLQRFYWMGAYHARPFLRHYPWQMFEEPESGINLGDIPGAQRGMAWLKFPNPEAPDEHVTIAMDTHVRAWWWSRRLGKRAKPERKAQVREIWFAGDPRFAAVIAAPGPRRFYLLSQRPDKRDLADPQNAGPEALARARRAGVRLPESTPQSASESPTM
ncbi:hypothetical protein OK074_4735 [Actinobacteria bacterium OK074]|nr:hypothetical protein OK074_4735 [Actinobacteria bacterium OK074]